MIAITSQTRNQHTILEYSESRTKESSGLVPTIPPLDHKAPEPESLEALSFIPNVKSNGIFQMLWNLFKILGGEVKEEDKT